MQESNILSFVLLLVSFQGFNCQLVGIVGTNITGYKGYNTLEVGNINIFISSPHQGAQTPLDIPDRQNVTAEGLVLDNFEKDNDLNSRNIARTIRNELTRLFKVNKNIDAIPYFLYTDLKRLF